MDRPSIESVIVLFAALTATPASFAQQARSAIASSDVLSQISMFNYRDGPKSDLFLRGTPIAANAQGTVQVEYQNDNASISARAWDLPEPSSLGPYTTYILWALTPDGRAVNQGVLALEDKGELETSYGASQFALIVTAEPHFAVGTPSDMITLYNVADKVEGEETKVTTLVERNDYSTLAVVPVGDDPLELAQARYSVAIAKAAGADRFAANQYASATQSLTQAETALAGGRKDRKTATDSARAAVIAGEDARRAATAGAAAEAERQRNAATSAAATQEAQRAAALQARQDLRNRLNAALPTEETDRGLVSEVGGVQFATGTAESELVRARGSRAFRRHRRVVSRSAIQRRRSHRQHRQPCDQQRAVVAPRRRSARIPHRTGNRAGTNRRRRPRPVEADRRQFDGPGRARNRRVEIILSGGPLAADGAEGEALRAARD